MEVILRITNSTSPRKGHDELHRKAEFVKAVQKTPDLNYRDRLFRCSHGLRLCFQFIQRCRDRLHSKPERSDGGNRHIKLSEYEPDRRRAA